ncbi:hypothetical protein ABT282_08680 [Streptomyces sp. NPDC000927]|uniref:hypothetical protein n=1 Tax=Streptomyces sp. NPDC000927 TaxID=3154371 RepID=UPI0033286735
MNAATSDILEESALLKALDHPDRAINLPDSERLTSQRLVTQENPGHFALTEGGVTAAKALRSIERDLIADDVLKVISKHESRVDATSSGWVAGVTTYAQRVFLDYTHPPRMASLKSHDWSKLCSALKSELGIEAEVDGDRLYLGALRRSRHGYALLPGSPDEARSDRIHAGHHANAVWNDLCNSDNPRVSWGYAPGDEDWAPPAGLSFHYASRTVMVCMNENSYYEAGIATSGQPDAGRSWAGHRIDIVVKSMIRDLSGTPCAHGCTTGSGSCPGCDATEEDFKKFHNTLKAMPGSKPSMTRMVFEGVEPMLSVHKVYSEW